LKYEWDKDQKSEFTDSIDNPIIDILNSVSVIVDHAFKVFDSEDSPAVGIATKLIAEIKTISINKKVLSSLAFSFDNEESAKLFNMMANAIYAKIEDKDNFVIQYIDQPGQYSVALSYSGQDIEIPVSFATAALDAINLSTSLLNIKGKLKFSIHEMDQIDDQAARSAIFVEVSSSSRVGKVLKKLKQIVPILQNILFIVKLVRR
jgi:hypothetical protein